MDLKFTISIQERGIWSYWGEWVFSIGRVFFKMSSQSLPLQRKRRKAHSVRDY